jgi:hypothetical protein|tara:strand:- start:2359 stop:3201 length:843 start_codon:yes stop_codon:yes gene_type:complete
MSGREEAALLMGLITMQQTKFVLEIGVAKGGMAISIAHAIKDNGTLNAKYVGLDLWDAHGLRMQFPKFGDQQYVEDVLSTTGATNLEYKLYTINTLTETVRLKSILTQEFPEKIDFAFIDGCHSYYGVATDFFNVWPFMSDKGIVAFHDTASIDGCREFVHDLRVNNTGEYEILDLPWGMGTRQTGVTIISKRISKLSMHSYIDEACGSKHFPKEIEQLEIDYYNKNLNLAAWDSINPPKFEETNGWSNYKNKPLRKKFENHFFNKDELENMNIVNMLSE